MKSILVKSAPDVLSKSFGVLKVPIEEGHKNF
jgi:hypothetical protein